MKEYVLTAKSYPWLLEAVEASLANIEDGTLNDSQRFFRGLRTSSGRPISDSEALIALNALCDLGIVERLKSRFRFHKQRWFDTAQFRDAVQKSVAILNEQPQDVKTEAQLCVSLPPNLAPASAHVIRESSTDLRSGVLDVIASAQQSLLIASPFWDAGTTEEIATLAGKKLNAGVSICLLGRFGHDFPLAVRKELNRIANDPKFSILSWFEGSGVDTQTFHFKAISADRGLRGYLGSANMTMASLRSRMELGVVLTGKASQQLDRILRVVVTLASPVGL